MPEVVPLVGEGVVVRMCRTKINGGRRCKSSEAAYRANKKATALAEAAVTGVPAPGHTIGGHHELVQAPARIPQAVADAANHDARVATYTRADIPATDAQEWADLPIHPDAGIEWATAGFTPSEVNAWLTAIEVELGKPDAWRAPDARYLAKAVDWTEVGITNPNEALEWDVNGVEPEAARLWQGTGIPVREAVQWYRNAIGSQEAPAWRDAGFHQTNAGWWIDEYSPQEARQWADAGVPDGAEAKGWEQDGTDADEARRWIAAGCECADTARTYADQLPGVPRESVLAAYQCGYTAVEAAGLDWDDPDVAAGLQTIGALKAGIGPSSATV